MENWGVIIILVVAFGLRAGWNYFGEHYLEPSDEELEERRQRSPDVGPTEQSLEVRKERLRHWMNDNKH